MQIATADLGPGDVAFSVCHRVGAVGLAHREGLRGHVRRRPPALLFARVHIGRRVGAVHRGGHHLAPELLPPRGEVLLRDEPALDDVAIGFEEGDLGGAEPEAIGALRVPGRRASF